MIIEEEENYTDYSDFLFNLRNTIDDLQNIHDYTKKEEVLHKLITSTINFSIELSDSGDNFEAAEFLSSASDLFEGFEPTEVFEIYKIIITFYEKQIESLKVQVKFHEIAELYLKIAELYGEKFQDEELEEQNIIKSIKYLKQEIKLIKDFNGTGTINETRKLAQNYQNIAELYLRIQDCIKAIRYYERVINISKNNNYFDILSFTYQRVASCYEELDDYNHAKEIMLDGIEYFQASSSKFKEKNNQLALSQIYQILKKFYSVLKEEKQFIRYSKKEAGAYINLAERLEKKADNFQKIARYYRGAALCYQEINNNLIECASCLYLGGNYSEKIEDYNEAAISYFDGATIFKELNNLEKAYKLFIKAGNNFWKVGNINDSTEAYLNANDVAIEGNLEFNRYGLFNEIVKGLNKIAKKGLKNKQFYTAATLILESIKYYEQLETAEDFLIFRMLKSVYRYYYKAASLKNISLSHIVHSYVLAALCCILRNEMDEALEIMSEIDYDTKTVKEYKDLIKYIVRILSEREVPTLDTLPFKFKKLVENSEEIIFLLDLCERMWGDYFKKRNKENE
ncbi:hypothetical protein ES705_14467 [subsurface metagenome]